MSESNKSDNYSKAGVNVERGDKLSSWLQKSDTTNTSGVVSGIGGFASLFKVDFKKYSEPLLVSSADGVGTKVILAIENNKVNNIGFDLVAMCVNDLYTVGAEPLFFLDYFATSNLNEEQFKDVLNSIKNACIYSNMALIGGETAEMPDLYKKGDFDLAGFVVGVVEEKKALSSSKVKTGDSVIRVASSGFHSNGFSLIRKWLNSDKGVQYLHKHPNLLEKLLQPTTIYKELPDLVDLLEDQVHAIAHITGGGISGNLKRVIPDNFCAELKIVNLNTEQWMIDFINYFSDEDETYLSYENTFNLGTGMMLIVDEKCTSKCIEFYKQHNISANEIGKIVKNNTNNSTKTRLK